MGAVWRLDGKEGDRRTEQAQWKHRVPFSRPRSSSRHGPGSPRNVREIRVLIDGQPPGAAHGIDVDEQGDGTMTEQRLYQLIRQPRPIVDRQFGIEFLGPGVEAFAFTFG